VKWVTIQVVRGRRFGSMHAFVIRDAAGRAVTPRPLRLWPERRGFAGHLCGLHAAVRHCDNIEPDRWFEGTHLLDEQLLPAAAIRYEIGPHVFGRFRYEVEITDEFGNRSADEAVTFHGVISSWPAPARGLRVTGWDESSGRLSFCFETSEQLVG
jgi:hypothetical protein